MSSVGLARVSDVYVFPASYAQQRLWFLSQLVPGNAFYNVDLALRLADPIDEHALERALGEIVRRHEVLRTTFQVLDGQPVQVVAPDLPLPLTRIDVSHLPESDREPAASRLASDEAQRPFDLVRGPLIRTALITLADCDQVLLITMHHIVSDGWSVQVFFRELNLLYTAFASGEESPLPELAIQYADFAIWQRDWLEGEVYARQLAYWCRKLEGLNPLQLPTDRPRPPVQSYRGATLEIDVAPWLHEALQALSRQEGTTLFMTMLAAFTALLHRYTGQDEIVLGSPIANRNRAEIEQLIGFFVNSLVLRLDASGNPTFRELLHRTREVALEAYAHQDLPFEKLVEELAPERDMSRNPLYQVSFQLFGAHPGDRTPPSSETTLRPFHVEKGTANIDLAVDIGETAAGLSVRVEFSADLFDESTIVRLLGHYQTLLGAIANDPSLRVSELPLLTADEMRTVRDRWSQNRVDLPPIVTTHHLFEDQVRRSPDAVATLLGVGGAVTYGELNRRATRLARRLVDRGVRRGSIVGICLPRSADLIAAILATWKAGAAYLPFEPGHPAARLQWMARDASICATISTRRLVETTGSLGPPGGLVDVDEILGPADAETDTDVADPIDGGATPDDAAYVIYTSGSTGRPKGVVVPHRAVCNYLLWMQWAFPLSACDCVLQKYSISFDVSLWEIFGPLIAGARLAIVESGRHLDWDYHVELLACHGVTMVDVVPAVLAQWIEEPRFATVHTLRRVVCGGEAMPPDLPGRFFRSSNAELHNFYGPTETTISSTCHRCLPDDDPNRISIGTPIGNTTVYVLDQYGNIAPIGVSGELHIGGAGLALGYLGDEALTRDRFVDRTVRPGEPERLYRTGDRVRFRADGVLEFLGRVDAQVKIRGFRVELGEIEARLEQHPAVRDAVVTMYDGDHLSQEPDREGLLSPIELMERLGAIPPRRAEELLEQVQELLEPEVEFLAEYETSPTFREGTVRRKLSDLDVFVRVPTGFMPTPREQQRNWMLQRTLDEFIDDLRHLDGLSRRLITGSDRAEIQHDFRTSAAHDDGTQLVIEGQQVMQAWERPLMRAMAEIVTASHGDVLELGFGMGISATYIQEMGVRSHTIVECNDDVAGRVEQWRARYGDRDIRLVKGRWQDVVERLGTFDGIFFDTYPLDEDEFAETVINSITFAEHFIPHAARLCRAGGILTYYSNEIDSFSRRHQRLVLQHFGSIALSTVRALRPPPDCHYWWADSMVAIKAVK